MKYMLEVRGHDMRMGALMAKTVTVPTYFMALEMAFQFATECAEKWDEVTDIWVVLDADWCANKWNAGQHFSFDNMKMGFRMYRNGVQE